MKFLLLYPGLPSGSHNVVYYMARALGQLGQLVYLSDPKGMRRSAALFKPDVLMVFHGIRLEMDEVRALRRMGVFTIFWGGDEEDWFHYYIKISPEFDLWCCYCTATLYAHQQAGARAIYFPYAADPALFFPVRLKGDEKGIYESDIAFVGCHYPEREFILRRLAQQWRVKVRWSGSESGQRVVEQIDFETLRKIYSGAKVVLDPFSTCDRQRVNFLGAKRSYGLPCRSFEVPACKAFSLQPFREDLPMLYKVGEEVEAFSDEGEMMDKLSFYLRHPERREEMASKAYRRTLRDHTYERRTLILLEAIEKAISSRFYLRGASRTPEVSVVMPVFNGLMYTVGAIDSLIRYTSRPFELIVVDNGSTDGTWEYLKTVRTGGKFVALRVIRNLRNLGFPKACNQGMRQARGKYIVILNNDVVLTEGWIEGLIRPMEEDPAVGLVGPMTNFVSGEQLVENVTYRSEEEMQRFAFEYARRHRGERKEVSRLVAFCLLIRQEVLEKVGLFDETFGIGNFEDDDLCLRARLAGYKAVIARDVFVHHHGSRTFMELGLDYRRLIKENKERFRKKWASLFRKEAKELSEEAARLWERGRKEEALEACRMALEADPYCVQAHNNLAFIHWERGEVKEALRHLEEAMRLDPEDRDVVWNCGQIMAGMGRLQDAYEVYQSYLQRHRDEEMEEALRQMEGLMKGGRTGFEEARP